MKDKSKNNGVFLEENFLKEECQLTIEEETDRHLKVTILHSSW